MSEEKTRTPMNDLDLQMMLTEPDWGKKIPPALKQKLSKTQVYAVQNEDGTQSYEFEFKDNLWELLAFYRKEMRLAYLNAQELIYCQYYIDMAADCLSRNMPDSFILSLQRAVTVIELSQSKGGFLRKRHGTVETIDTKRQEQEKPKSILERFKK